MLSAVGRAALRRVVTPRPWATNASLQSVLQLQRVNIARQPLLSPWRLYATARVAQTKVEKVKTKTKSTTKKAAKKPTKTKKKAAKPKPKPKPKRPAKKILTEEQKEKLHIKLLKQKALSPPPKKATNAWSIFLSDVLTGSGVQTGTSMRDASEKFKSLSPQELESYARIANENKAANEVALKEWTKGFTPDEIRLANNARTQLRNKTGSSKKWHHIADVRLPKRPLTPVIFYIQDRYASGDYKGETVNIAAPRIYKEWASLSPSERKVYEDRSQTDKERYYQEFKTAYGRESEMTRPA